MEKASYEMSLAASKVLVLVFTDLAGSTSLKAEKGDEVAGALIARYRNHVKQQSGANGGRIIDWAGDGCFLTFETPSAAVRFALNLQYVHAKESDLPKVYVGMHMGEVVERPAEGKKSPLRIEGLSVDTAARIQSLALPGQILMSGAVFNSARQRLNSESIEVPILWQAHGAYHFKDFDDFLQIGEVGLEGVSPFEPPTGSKRVQRAVTRLEEDTLGWRPAPGVSLPGRVNWRLLSHLGTGGFGEIWLAAHVETNERHVFKFCFQPDRLRGLKREVVLLRLLKESLGDREDIARVISWELSNQPYYIETEYTEGGDLKTWAAGQGGIGAVPLKTRLGLAAQIAAALSAAHGAGVLHKDIKPSNILISQSKAEEAPRASLMDFGIGLLTEPEVLKEKNITAMGLTETLAAGSSSSGSGTALYMAPELLEGKPPTQQSDVYSLGVLLYQMVIGDLSRALASDWEQGVEDELLREDIAACVHGVPESRLTGPAMLEERLRSFDERRRLRESEYQAEKNRRETEHRRRRIRKVLVYGVASTLIVALITVLGLLQYRNSRREAMKSWAYETALPKIKKLLEAGELTSAFFLAKEAEPYIPNDPSLVQCLKASSGIINIHTTPPGAKVAYRPYNDINGKWIEAGVTPIEHLQIPAGMLRWRIQKEGYRERELAMPVVPTDSFREVVAKAFNLNPGLDLSLHESNPLTNGMVSVDRGKFLKEIPGVQPTTMSLEEFFIDRTEVTNKAFKEFVDAGGYSDPKYWKQEFKRGGSIIPWAEAMKTFVDRTGKPGPSTWEVGDYPEGRGDYPVSGVSWFEAAAFAEFKKESLPTIYHWIRAAYSPAEHVFPLTPLIIPQSNFGGAGPAPVGSYPGIGSSGAKDLAGNVREWCWNANGEKRYILGGMWKDPSYMFNSPVAISSWDRSPGNGFRCALYPQGSAVPDQLFAELNIGHYDPYSVPPFSKEVYQTIKRMFSYVPTPLHPVIEAKEEASGQGWKREKVSIDAAYNKERLILHLDLPVSGTPPYKAVIYFPSNSASTTSFALTPLWEPWDAIPRSGRVLVTPAYSGSFERGERAPMDLRQKRISEYFPEWVKDLGRTIDYLKTRSDIDTGNIAFLGLSLGAAVGPHLASYEDRIKVLILVAGGMSYPASQPKPRGQALAFMTAPTLMLNGRLDCIFPVETSQKPLFDLLGTPPEHKRHVVYEAGHVPLPRAEMLKEILRWLDKYQGPPKFLSASGDRSG